MGQCGMLTLLFVFVMIFMGALYAQSNEDDSEEMLAFLRENGYLSLQDQSIRSMDMEPLEEMETEPLEKEPGKQGYMAEGTPDGLSSWQIGSGLADDRLEGPSVARVRRSARRVVRVRPGGRRVVRVRPGGSRVTRVRPGASRVTRVRPLRRRIARTRPGRRRGARRCSGQHCLMRRRRPSGRRTSRGRAMRRRVLRRQRRDLRDARRRGRRPTRINNRTRGLRPSGSRSGTGTRRGISSVRRTLRRARRLGNASTPFAARLWRKVFPELSHDAVLSTHSIHTVFSMVLNGARGRTERQIFNALGLRQARLRGARAHRAYQALLRSLTHTHRDVHVLSANAVFVKPFIPLELNFRRQLETMYMARFATLATSHPERDINAWITSQTRGIMSDVLPPNSIDNDTAMVLVNALYLNASWAQPFNTLLTRQRPFASFSEGEKMLDTMETDGVFKYADHQDATVFELPFKGDRLAMTILLPSQTSDISALLHALAGNETSPSNLDSLLTNLQPTFLKVVLPKFSIDSGLVNVKQALRRMGIRRAFDGTRANFTGISVSPLHINKVFHRAVVDVNEQGTMAAASSAVYFNPRSSVSEQEVVVNRPFAFLIRDTRTRTLLFWGAYLGQSASSGS